MTVLGCPLSHVFTSSITDDFNIAYDMFRFTVIMHEFYADVKLLKIILKKLRTTH